MRENAMDRKFWISAVVAFVLLTVLAFIVHSYLLAADYAKLSNIMRPEADINARLIYILLAHVSAALAMTWIYVEGREDKPWLGQGIRYGIAVVMLAVVPVYLIYHAVTPTPLDVAVKQIIYDGISFVIVAVVVAWINR
jgi:hypothetical protein